MRNLIIGILLLCVNAPLYAQPDDEVLMSVGGTDVMRSEFEYAYNKNGARNKVLLTEFTRSFVHLKLLVLEAENRGLDTVSSFRNEMERLSSQTRSRVQVCPEGNVAPHSEPLTRLAHLYIYLPQNVASWKVQVAHNRMDSIYRAILAGDSFEECVHRFVHNHPNDLYGEQVVLPVSHLMSQMGYKAKSLRQGELSRPFTTPVGVHLIQMIGYEEKSGQVENQMISGVGKVESESYLLTELRESLLVKALLKDEDGGASPERLAAFFKSHKKQYTWDLPHYKGGVLYCKDKATAKEVEALLKRMPMEQWEVMVESYNRKYPNKAVKATFGLFQIGSNPAIDKIIFKQGTFLPSSDFPFVAVIGKKLKKGPESYRDVLAQVESDYDVALRKKIVEQCTKKYKVEINQEVLKTVNNR